MPNNGGIDAAYYIQRAEASLRKSDTERAQAEALVSIAKSLHRIASDKVGEGDVGHGARREVKAAIA